MPDTPTTAAIAAAASIVSSTIALIPTVLSRSDEKKRFLLVATMATVEGTWEGKGIDSYVENASKPIPFTLSLRLFTKRNKIFGTGKLNDVDAQLEVEGGFFNDRYIQLAYKSKEPNRMQMGVIVLHLSGEGNILSGHYAGFSPTRETFVMGSVILNRR